MPKLPKIKKKYLWGSVILVGAVAYFSGFATGWIWPKRGQMGEFPAVDAQTRLLVVAPHPDDEVLIAGGLMQRVKAAGGDVKIIYLTSGDGSRSTAVTENKKADLNPSEFLTMGEQRMGEASAAAAILGAGKEMVFLGFPDQGLARVWRGSGISPTTKFDHVPYTQAMKPGQAYTGVNLEEDVASVAAEFKPTMVVTTHLRDRHPDHKAAFEVIEKVRENLGAGWPIMAAVVHWRNWPEKGDWLFPPKKLFGSDWVSLELTDAERQAKKEAVQKYKSQYDGVGQKTLFDRLTARNEIFEVEEPGGGRE